jgi:predicted NBD/HSP70 family sugar kinase
MRLYVGADLHANNIFVAVIDKKGKRLEQKRMERGQVSTFDKSGAL